MDTAKGLKRKRYELLDTIRGVMLVSMVIYHASWNLVYLYGIDWPWYQSKGAYVWQQSICWTFILLSGFCFSFGKNHWKNGGMVWGSGWLVTWVTILVMPSNRVVFGVLTCIGSCILLMAVAEKYLKKFPVIVGCMMSMVLFLLTKNMNEGFLGFGEWRFYELPQAWYKNYLTTYIGFPFKGFFTTDYFSLFPWFFLFTAGFYLYQIAEKYQWLKFSFFKKKISVFAFLGRHTLLIYLLHQPVIFFVQELIFHIK